MRAIVIHEAKDLRVEDHDAGKPGRARSGSAWPSAASAARTCITTTTEASDRFA